MSERVTDVLTAHQRQGSNACLCGWSKLGHSFPAHQAGAVTDALFSEESIERAAEAAEASGILPSNGNDQQDRTAATGIVRAVVVALRGEA